MFKAHSLLISQVFNTERDAVCLENSVSSMWQTTHINESEIQIREGRYQREGLWMPGGSLFWILWE